MALDRFAGHAHVVRQALHRQRERGEDDEGGAWPDRPMSGASPTSGCRTGRVDRPRPGAPRDARRPCGSRRSARPVRRGAPRHHRRSDRRRTDRAQEEPQGQRVGQVDGPRDSRESVTADDPHSARRARDTRHRSRPGAPGSPGPRTRTPLRSRRGEPAPGARRRRARQSAFGVLSFPFFFPEAFVAPGAGSAGHGLSFATLSSSSR